MEKEKKRIGFWVTLVVLAAALVFLYIYVLKPMQERNSETTGESKEKRLPMPTRDELAALGYTASEIEALMSSDAYKNGTLNSW